MDSKSSVNERGSSSENKVFVENDEVIIHPKREMEFLRFRKRPEEMVRRLLLELIGAEELKTMTVFGHGRSNKPRKGIPENIRIAVFGMHIYLFIITFISIGI